MPDDRLSNPGDHAGSSSESPHVDKPDWDGNREVRSVGVIGAGLSGLLAATWLASRGFDVQVFEKSRGAGGRMATRRTDDGLQFDHGAQYFTVRDPQFKEWVDRWMSSGIVAPWDARITSIGDHEPSRSKSKTSTQRFVGVPTMNAPCKHLAANLNVHYNVRIERVYQQLDQWRIERSDDQADSFDAVLLTAPAAQSAELLRTAHQFELRESIERAEDVVMQGCWAAMLAFRNSLDLPFDGAFVHNSPLSWIARNSSKPARPKGPECWVVHASPEWSEEHLESEPESVLPQLITSFAKATDQKVEPIHSQIHRWRYSIPPKPMDQRFLASRKHRVLACGDWCGGPRVEGAALSGLAAAAEIASWTG